tara:strand:+ start:1632 stop:1808 length:177 start_codon:yes stop_codon:yes gene_type:complete
MIEKDSRYWALHKETYWDELLDLDQDVQDNIIKHPHGKEAKLLEKRVERIMEERLVLN